MEDAPTVLPCGDRALLLELPADGDVRGLAGALEGRPLPGQVELVPAARTVLVRLDREPTERDVAVLRRLRAVPVPDRGAAAEVVLDVVFDGPDLTEAAALAGRSPEALVRVLTTTRLAVAFTGFAPGFGYLTGLPSDVHVPRRSTPRTRVPAGAVGLAGPYAGVYPRASPGGWQLVGRTDALLFDVDRDPPALLAPGAAVRFPGVLTVLAPGLLATVQDLGRTGWAAIGVPRSGAADRAAHALANRLVGNDASAATLEVTAGGLRLRADRSHLVAVSGAPAPVTVDGRPGPLYAPFTLRPGAELALGLPPVGLRSYLAVRGGVAARPVLGSRSTDTLSGLGPAPLRAGDELPVGRLAADEPVVDVAPVGAPSPRPVLRVLPGPRRDRLAADAWTLLTTAAWAVTPASDRVGLRLAGPQLRRSGDSELPSEGLVPGAVQVPPDGAPVLFLADHPVTGGYPVLAVVRTADLPKAAQVRPGDVLRFSPAR